MASVFFAMLAYLNGQTLVTTLAASILGRRCRLPCAGISSQPRIFMGDGGRDVFSAS